MTRRQAEIAGSFAAMTEHARVGTVLKNRVDIFQIIEKAGIWLMFQPMKDVYGAFTHEGDAAGIIINSNHPPQLQRSTAAHEYGHFVLGHTPSIDDQSTIEESGSLPDEEIAAQAFAANFLMPLQLVNVLLQRMELSDHVQELTAKDVYTLSLHMGVSYLATLNHLATIHKLPWIQARKMKKISPKEIKASLSERALIDPWADIWHLGEWANGLNIFPRVNDEIALQLIDLPSSGYVWEPVDSSLSSIHELELIEERSDTVVQPGDEERAGTGALHRFVFRVLTTGETSLNLSLGRPWEDSKRSTFQLVVEATPGREKDIYRGLVPSQQFALAL